MGKIKKLLKGNASLKWSFFLYLPICFVLSVAGAFAIGVSTNYMQEWFRNKYSNVELSKPSIEIFVDENGKAYTSYVQSPYFDDRQTFIYEVISNAQLILIPIWVMLCVGITGRIFYSCELKEPVNILLKASEKISENQLDFEIYYYKKNEMGQLCEAFNNMRKALFENNRELWNSLEERKRLNSAFSHDLRTPLTVLKGYTEFLGKYASSGKITKDKLSDILDKMNGQILRLEHYTRKMSEAQKLEDITPDHEEISLEELSEQLLRNGNIICGEKNFEYKLHSDGNEKIYADIEILMQVYENILSNAARYAAEKVSVTFTTEDKSFYIEVQDDGKGFSEEALKKAADPFFRDEKSTGNGKNHFGLGLYICKILCEKHGGRLLISNNETGGKVTAFFSENR